jgi:hypothetical protein
MASGKFQPPVVRRNMSISPDGRYLIFPQRDHVGSDLMLIRDFEQH